MFWVHRENEVITAITEQPNGSSEQLPKDDPEIISFLNYVGPTNDEIYNQTMQNDKIIKALVLSLNSAGAFSEIGAVLSNSELKTRVKSNM